MTQSRHHLVFATVFAVLSLACIYATGKQIRIHGWLAEMPDITITLLITLRALEELFTHLIYSKFDITIKTVNPEPNGQD